MSEIKKYLDKDGLSYFIDKLFNILVGKKIQNKGEIFNDYTNNQANGQFSHSEGQHTISTNQAEHAEGKFNISRPDQTIHSIGVGTSNEDRKNALEVGVDGSTYIMGIGDFLGNNHDSAETIQSIINKSNDHSYVENETLKQIGGNNLLVESGNPHTIIFTDEDVPTDIVVREAPKDSKLYGRKNGAWNEIVAEVPEAPVDNGMYARSNKSWTKFAIPSLSGYATEQWVNDKNYLTQSNLSNYITEAPKDSKLYGRKNGAWNEIVAEVPEAPKDGKIYGRMDGQWVVNEPSSPGSSTFDVIENVLITSTDFQTVEDILILM